MRTAITLARTHGGKWQLLANPEDSLIDQKKTFRAFRADKAHKDYSQVVYQESDGSAEIIRLLTLEQKKAQEEQAAKDAAASKAFDEKVQKKAQEKPAKDAAKK